MASMITKPSSGEWGKWTPAEEAKIEARKAELRAAWRRREILKTRAYLDGARGTMAWADRFNEIHTRFGRQFARDVLKRG